jgi:DNA (cytosine-5)-methyltransferase 1
MNGLDLFSGIGGISIALKQWVRPIAYCENDRYAQGVLLSRMRSGHIIKAPIWDDVRTLHGCDLITKPEIIYGGFPCQDISVAGIGTGLGGERSGLFFHIARLIKETNPRFVFLENVPAIRTRGLNGVVQTLTELGYDSRWTIVSAAEVGAVHIRKRWFLLAHSNSMRLREKQREKLKRPREVERSLESDCQSPPREASQSSTRALAPRVDRTGDGLSYCVDRNRALGNSVVPSQAKEAFMKLMRLS